MTTVKTLAFDVSQMPRELARSEAIQQQQQPERHTPLRAIAQSLSKRGIAEAKTELVNAALVAFVDVLFDADPDGIMPNVDADGRVLIPCPWGKSGAVLWSLRITEGRALNVIMRQRAHGDALFIYDADAHCWLIGRGYSSRRVALAYLRQCPVTLAEWRAAWQVVRSEWSRQNLDRE